jgi:hypothetical protein
MNIEDIELNFDLDEEQDKLCLTIHRLNPSKNDLLIFQSNTDLSPEKIHELGEFANEALEECQCTAGFIVLNKNINIHLLNDLQLKELGLKRIEK